MAATYDPAADDFSADDLGPRRTSILAIISLILSLICIIPGAGLLGAIFGLAGIIGISQSRGRVGGMGLAIAGLALGLLFTAIQVGVVVGASRFLSLVQRAGITPVVATMTAIDAQDHSGARAVFNPALSSAITDEQLDRFREAYRAEVGAFKTIPIGWLELIQAVQQAGNAFQTFGHSQMQNVIPFPAQFDQGWTIVAIEIPQQMKNGKTIEIMNIGIFSIDGKKQIWLDEAHIPRQLAPPAPASAPPATPTPPAPDSPARVPEPASPEKGPS